MNNSPAELTTPQEDADRIRLKRLAKLSSATPQPESSASKLQQSPPPKPKPSPIKRPITIQPLPAPPAPKRQDFSNVSLDMAQWEGDTVSTVLGVTLNRDHAEKSHWEVVWLKGLANELIAENPSIEQPLVTSIEIIDRLLIARLELDPNSMSDDPEILTVLASLPPQQTVFEYLIGCWKRLNTSRLALSKKGYRSSDIQQATPILDKLRDLLISYAGLNLQDPSMFPQPTGKPLGAQELVAPLLALSSSSPLYSTPDSATSLSPSDIGPFLTDLCRRFETDGLEDVLGDVIIFLAHSEALTTPDGLGGTSTQWRSVLGALEGLTGIKPIAIVLTRLTQWNPSASAVSFEKESLLGPITRMSVFGREWPAIAQTYFSEIDKRSPQDIESSYTTLRSTLSSLQSSLFQIFNSAVRASPESREAVLDYFAHVIELNVKRGGMRVDSDTVASDGFMINLQSVLMRFAEPFMDAKYSKIDRIDPLYFAHSTRLILKDETRIKATSAEVAKWEKDTQADGGGAPNFISDIFYLVAAFNHFGLGRTIQSLGELRKAHADMKRQLDEIEGDTSFQGTPMQARVEQAIQTIKNEMAKVDMQSVASQVQLLDSDFTFKMVGLTSFISTWLIRLVDPRKMHPARTIELPLPKEVPVSFKMLPEYFIEDIVDYHLFLVQNNPSALDMSGKVELVDFAVTFLSSTWYITNPYLKSKLVAILRVGLYPFGRFHSGVLGETLHSHPLALKHLLGDHYPIGTEVEQTGTHTQFFDKFDIRRNIGKILQWIWTHPIHREALNRYAQDLPRFIRFANLLMNDCTFILDESLTKLAEIFTIQGEMADKATWDALPPQQRREREGLLRSHEGQAQTWIHLSKSNIDLLKEFTARAQAPFISGEMVDRLAAMLNYNLDSLVGPRCSDLKVKDMEKYGFQPRALLSDILQIYLNLGEQEDFIRAVAGEGRSYRKELFDKAAAIAKKRALKTDSEIEQLRTFVMKVEEMRLAIEAEEDLGEVPDDFLDPLMYSMMRDPVILPSSRTVVDFSTIKAHLLSDGTDPFNRVPLKVEEVVPDTALKERITTFVLERRQRIADAKLKKALEEAEEADRMDKT